MIVIRDATPNDYPGCAGIFEAAWNGVFPAAQRNISVVEFAAETADEIVLVAIAEERLRGFASLYVPESFLHHLYIEPAAQRLRIGAALLSEAIVRAAGALTLKCHLSNSRARAFYAKRDFVEGGYGDDAYGPWVRLVMRRHQET